MSNWLYWTTRARVAMWRGDDRVTRDVIDGIRARGPLGDPVELSGRFLAREIGVDETLAGLGALLSVEPDRLLLRAMARELECEMRTFAGDLEGGERAAIASEGEASYNLSWFERAPLLAPLRGRPGFEESKRRVEARAASVLDVIDREAARLTT